MLILVPVLIPLLFAVLILCPTCGKKPFLNALLAWLGAAVVLGAAVLMFILPSGFSGAGAAFMGIEFGFTWDMVSGPVLLFMAAFVCAGLWWAGGGVKERWFSFAVLLTLSFASGAVLASNMVVMLFFWEGLLISLYIFLIMQGTEESRVTAGKAFILNAVGDVFLLAGVVFCAAGMPDASFAGMSGKMLIGSGCGTYAFVCLVTGAMAKAGAVPFHSWLPAAAKTAKTSFMAMLPGAVEKLLAVYLLVRVFPLFNYIPSDILMILGAFSIIPAAVMLFACKDLKVFIAYNVVLQIGLLVFEMGANPFETPVAVLNHGVYKAGALALLFLCAGNIERAFGTTDIAKISGVFKKMKLTAAGFIIAGAALCKVTVLDIFFSGSFYGLTWAEPLLMLFALLVTAAVFAAFLRVTAGLFAGGGAEVKRKAGVCETAPVLLLTVFVLLYQIGWAWGEGSVFALPHAHLRFGAVNGALLAVLALSAAAYVLLRKYKKDLSKAKGVSVFYNMLETGRFDAYTALSRAGGLVSHILYNIDRMFDFFIDDMPHAVVRILSKRSAVFQTGYNYDYILWAVLGAVVFALLSFGSGGLF